MSLNWVSAAPKGPDMLVRFSHLALAQTSRAFAEAVRCLIVFLTYLVPGLCKSIHFQSVMWQMKNIDRETWIEICFGVPCLLVLA